MSYYDSDGIFPFDLFMLEREVETDSGQTVVMRSREGRGRVIVGPHDLEAAPLDFCRQVPARLQYDKFLPSLRRPS